MASIPPPTRGAVVMSDSNEASNDSHQLSDAEDHDHDHDHPNLDLDLDENQHQNPADPNADAPSPDPSADPSSSSSPPPPKLTTSYLPIFPLPPLPAIPDAIIRKKVFTHTSMARIQRAAEGQQAKQKGAFEDPIGEPTMHYEKLEFVGDSWVLLLFFFLFSFFLFPFLFLFFSFLFFSFLVFAGSANHPGLWLANQPSR
jgi:hypothetical protein